MPRVPTRVRSGESIPIGSPPGSVGLDQNSDPTTLPPGALSLARDVVLLDGVGRRNGSRKVFQFTDTAADYGAKVFGTDAKYARFRPPLIPKGGFEFHFHFTAVRPTSGATTRYLWSSWTSHANFNSIGVIWGTIGSTGNFTILVNWEGGSSVATSISVLALTDGGEYHGLLVYDPKAGTLTLYLNGEVAGTPVTGLDDDLQPRQDSGVDWYLGVSYDPGVGVDTGRSFTGYLDAIGCSSLAGIDIADEDADADPPRRSMLTQLRRESWCDIRNPDSGLLLFHYGLDEPTAGTGTMYDASRYQNHGTYFGSPTNAARIAIRAQNGQYLGTVRRAAVGDLRDGRVNVVIVGGDVYYEILEPGT